MQRKKNGILNSTRFSASLPDSLTPLPSLLLPTSPPQTSLPLSPLQTGFLQAIPVLASCPSHEPPKPVTQLPLLEVAGSEGIIWVQAPFLMSNFSQTEVQPASFIFFFQTNFGKIILIKRGKTLATYEQSNSI